jgi:hypothetical protein
MKTITAGLLLLAWSGVMNAQNRSVIDQAVESGKVLVDLIKVFSNNKYDTPTEDCVDRFADLCVANSRESSLTVAITHRASQEIRDLIIQPDSRECSLQLAIGVWTYEISVTGIDTTLRKGDILLEGCQKYEMSIHSTRE